MENKKRILWLDYVRVLITHTTERVYTLNAMTLAQESVYSRILSVFMFTVGRLGVPLFLFLTGFLMSGGDYEYEKLRSSNDEIADFPFANKKTSTTGMTNSAKNATDNGINILLTSV